VRSIPSQLALGELFAAAWRAFTKREADRTVSDYSGRLVGKRNWRRVFSPLLSAVPSHRADDFPAEMLFKSRPRRKDFPRTFTFQQGISPLVERMASGSGIELRCHARVQSVLRSPIRFHLTLADGSACRAHRSRLPSRPIARPACSRRLLPRQPRP